jgi:hypothetical protein
MSVMQDGVSPVKNCASHRSKNSHTEPGVHERQACQDDKGNHLMQRRLRLRLVVRTTETGYNNDKCDGDNKEVREEDSQGQYR